MTSSVQKYQTLCLFRLKSSVKRVLYEKKEDFRITQGLIVGRFAVGSCFFVSFDVISDHKMDDFCNLILLAEDTGVRTLGIGFEAKTTKLAIRVRNVCFCSKLSHLKDLFRSNNPSDQWFICKL